MDTFQKSGRLTGLKSVAADVLNIKPICAAENGIVEQLGQARGIKKALVKMVEQVAEDVKNSKDKILAIAHCNCRDRAEAVKNMILEKITVKDVIILDTAGISSMYAADGGVIVVV